MVRFVVVFVTFVVLVVFILIAVVDVGVDGFAVVGTVGVAIF